MSFGEYGSQKDIEIERLRERVAELQAHCGFTESIKTVEIARLREVLEWLNRKGGLGLDVHDRIRAALSHPNQTGKP